MPKNFDKLYTEGVRSNWRFVPSARGMATTTDNKTLYGAGDDMRKFYSDLKPTYNTFSNTNYNIKIGSGGTMAWVTYDEAMKDKEGKPLYSTRSIKI